MLLGGNSAVLFIIVLCQTVDSAIVPALLVFGDSIVDPGNNNMLLTPAKANLPPYGRDFPGHVPTGRFSNGRIPPDIIASKFGIKELVPAYQDPNLTEQDLLTGVSFASAASGYDNITSVLPNVFTLWDQLEMYKSYQARVEAIAGPAKTATIIGEGVYLVFTGANDILVSYFITSLRALTFDLPSYIHYVVNAADAFVRELYGLGGRRIGVVGLPPLGCIPAARTVGGGENRDCVDAYNQASITFNSELSNRLQQLNADLPASTIVYLNIYDVLHKLIQHGSDYGFEIVNKGCCGTGEIEASVLCNEFSPFTCPESDTVKYLFWDGFHPTERGYNIIVTDVLKQIARYLPQT